MTMATDLTLLTEFIVTHSHDGYVVYDDLFVGPRLIEAGRPGHGHVVLTLTLAFNLPDLIEGAEAHRVRSRTPGQQRWPGCLTLTGVVAHPLVQEARHETLPLTTVTGRGMKGFITDMAGGVLEDPSFGHVTITTTFAPSGLPRVEETPDMQKTSVLSFGCEQVYVVRLHRAQDGSVVLKAGGNDHDSLVFRDPPDRVSVVLQIDTLEHSASIYRDDDATVRATPVPPHTAEPAPSARRSTRQAGGETHGLLGQVSARGTVTHPPTTRR